MNPFLHLESERLILVPLSYQYIPKSFDYFLNKNIFYMQKLIFMILLKNQGELGYGLHSNNRRNGYMLEALKKVIYYAFTEIKLETLQAYTSTQNNPSVGLLEKLSFDYINTVEDDYSNRKLMSIYQINRRNWNDRK